MSSSLPLNKTCIIIPTYNEIDNIEQMIDKLFSLYPEISLLIVDDGSPDGTPEVIKSKQQTNSNIHLIERSGKLGLGTAYATGFKWAIEKGFEYVVQMDCDFSHDPEEVKNLISNCIENDLVIGSRYIGGIRIINWPFRRLLLSFLASIYIRIVTSISVNDPTGGFKCMKADLLRLIDLDQLRSNGYIFQLEVNYKTFVLGKKIKEVPIVFYERREGLSKMDGGIIFEALFSVIRLKVAQLMGKLV